MKKYKFTFILFLLENISSLTLFTSLIDGDRKLTHKEEIFVNNVIEEYFANLRSHSFNNIKKSFYEEQVKISIEYNDTLLKYNSEKEYMGIINDSKSFEKIFRNFNKAAGELESIKIESIIFSKQPYDYPIGNVFYLVLNKKFKNFSTKEIIYISKDTGKIYEHIIYIPTTI